ncbi:MAG: hypothetical protein HC913_21040 [Microscillaceae bacterium]|nr:hypothetical protein [Microscillaceae bacterium]
MLKNYTCWVSIFWLGLLSLAAQETPPAPLAHWVFHPNYTLDRNARNYPGPKVEAPRSRFQQFKTLGEPILFYEQEPSERLVDFLPPAQIPSRAFSVEFWLLNHVNLPVGTLLTLRSKQSPY